MQRLINFKRLEIQNLLSIGNDPVVIEFTKGLHIITGVNKDKEDRQNATGKSTIVDGLYLAITGDPIRDIKREGISNNITGQNCNVKLTFDVVEGDVTTSYTVLRVVGKTSKAQLLINGVEKTRDSMANTTDDILRVLGCTKSSLMNFLSMTVGITTPFFGKSSADRKQFIDGLLNHAVISKMEAFVKEDISTNNKLRDNATTKIETLRESKNQAVTMVEKQAAIKRDREENYKKSRSDYEQKLSTTRSKIEEFESKVIDVAPIKQDIDNQEQQVHKLRQAQSKIYGDKVLLTNSIDSARTLIKKIDNRDLSVPCSSCKRPFSEHDTELLKREKLEQQAIIDENVPKEAELSTKILKIDGAIGKLQQHIKTQNERVSNAKLVQSQIEALKTLEQSISSNIKSLDDNYNLSNKDDVLIADNVAQIDADIERVTTDLGGIKTQSDFLSQAKYAVSPDGLRAYCTKRVIALINKEITRYLTILNVNSRCVFDEYFEPTITSETGRVVSYFNFSGAERKSMDLAIMFAFISVMRLQGSARYNLVMFDELIDSSFDATGVLQVLELIKQEVQDHNLAVYLITHRKETFGLGDSTIIVQKENGITRRIS